MAKKNVGVVFSFEASLPGFKKALEQASVEIRSKMGDLMKQTAYEIAATAKDNVRASTNGDGDLADAIAVDGFGLRWAVGVSDVAITRRGVDRVHQRPFLYGFILEFGKAKTPAEPFMRPAVDSHIARFQSRVHQIGLVI